jgi:ATP-binding cassette subfamily C protein CydD
MADDSRWLKERARPARRRLVLAVALGELSGILLVLQTALLVAVGDGVIMGHKGARHLAPFFASLLGVAALRFFATWSAKRAAFRCASLVKRTVRGELIEGLRSIGPVAMAGMRTGEISEVVVDAVESLEGYYAGYLPQRAIATILPFTVLAVVFPLDWMSGLVLVLTAVFLPLSMIVIGDEAHARNQRMWATLARVSGRFLDALRGLATVKMFGASRREAQEIARRSDEYRLATMSVLRVAFLSSFMLEFITAVSIAIVAVLTGLRLLSGAMPFAPGYFILLVAPDYFLTLRTLGVQYHARMEAAGAADLIRGLLGKMGGQVGGGVPLAAAPPVQAAVSLAAAPPAQAVAASGTARRGGALEFRDVSVSHSGRRVLEGLSFSVAAGERVALVGPSGCGKSTIINVILGFVTPEGGTASIDGRDIRLIGQGELHGGLAWLPQRPTLFHASVRHNIGLGRPDAGGRELEAAARLAHVDEFAESLPSGLDTVVGEGGQGLSVGQVQRIALARLFLRSPRLILLDEPTAGLDATSEALVNASILELAEGRTLLMATHRPAVNVDRSVAVGAPG